MILEATHTHLYPGHAGKISGLAQMADIGAGRECLVEFSDGSAAPARIWKHGKEWQVRTSAYRTGAGTQIPEKRWITRLEEVGGQLTFRILKKAQGD